MATGKSGFFSDDSPIFGSDANGSGFPEVQAGLAIFSDSSPVSASTTKKSVSDSSCLIFFQGA